jgi:hypothetical protein
MICAVRSFENIDKGNIEEWLQSDACEVGFQHVRDRHCQCCRETREKKGVGEDDSEICTAMKRSLNSSQKQVIITNCFSK